MNFMKKSVALSLLVCGFIPCNDLASMDRSYGNNESSLPVVLGVCAAGAACAIGVGGWRRATKHQDQDVAGNVINAILATNTVKIKNPLENQEHISLVDIEGNVHDVMHTLVGNRINGTLVVGDNRVSPGSVQKALDNDKKGMKASYHPVGFFLRSCFNSDVSTVREQAQAHENHIGLVEKYTHKHRNYARGCELHDQASDIETKILQGYHRFSQNNNTWLTNCQLLLADDLTSGIQHSAFNNDDYPCITVTNITEDLGRKLETISGKTTSDYPVLQSKLSPLQINMFALKHKVKGSKAHHKESSHKICEEERQLKQSLANAQILSAQAHKQHADAQTLQAQTDVRRLDQETLDAATKRRAKSRNITEEKARSEIQYERARDAFISSIAQGFLSLFRGK